MQQTIKKCYRLIQGLLDKQPPLSSMLLQTERRTLEQVQRLLTIVSGFEGIGGSELEKSVWVVQIVSKIENVQKNLNENVRSFGSRISEMSSSLGELFQEIVAMRESIADHESRITEVVVAIKGDHANLPELPSWKIESLENRIIVLETSEDHLRNAQEIKELRDWIAGKLAELESAPDPACLKGGD